MLKATIFTSCYNQADYLPQAIESVLDQTYLDFEYLIYDDGSSDNSWGIIETYAAEDSRIKPFKLSKQKNVGCVINRSFRQMSGACWLWCPSDDVWELSLLAVKMQYLITDPDKVVYSNFIRIDEFGKELFKTTIIKRSPEEFRLQVQKTSPIGFTGISIPKVVLDLVGPFPEHLEFSEDFWWMVKATIKGVDFIGDPGYLYYKRIHSNRLTARNSDKLPLQADSIRTELREVEQRGST